MQHGLQLPRFRRAYCFWPAMAEAGDRTIDPSAPPHVPEEAAMLPYASLTLGLFTEVSNCRESQFFATIGKPMADGIVGPRPDAVLVRLGQQAAPGCA
jgi:hypothetical protein